MNIQSTCSLNVDQILMDLACSHEYKGVMYFGLADLDNKTIIEELSKQGKCELAGCTVAGISRSRIANDRVITAAAIYFDDEVSADWTGNVNTNLDGSYFTFSHNDLELENHLRNLKTFGGLAADYWKFNSQKVFLNGDVHDSGSVTFWAPLKSFYKAECSWQRMPGTEGIVTRSHNHLVQEINHKPAGDYYRQFVGEVELLGAFPVKTPNGNRTVLGGYRDDGSLEFTGVIKEGTEIQLLNIDTSDLLESIEGISVGHPESHSFGLMFSCCAREMMLQLDVKEEQRILSERFDDSMILYVYGELLPEAESSRLENEYAVCVSLELGHSK